MRDPFTFNHDLIRRELYTDTHGRRWIRVWYATPMPDGGKIGRLIELNDPHADRRAQQALEATFRHHVAGLSAHARLTWMAVARVAAIRAKTEQIPDKNQSPAPDGRG
ncbi:hypothetical protein RNZ50_08800 [Paracoccaceae bacterium Fryx2]|nr:hypothetical protein [Paracoccaceae bacterium Fryx2]